MSFGETRGQLTVRMEQRAFGGILCLLRGHWCVRWLGVCICTDASEKSFAVAVREGCRELTVEVGRVSERTTPGPSVPGRVLFAPSYRSPVRTRM